jgi:sarcosine oxidase
MPERHDVLIAGLGAMGSAAAFHLARQGQRVLGLDRFAPPHTFGSSHGQTRIIREAYFEHPAYVPLVQRAYTLWAELAAATQMDLFRQTGGLMIGAADSAVFSGAKQSAELHRLPHEVLSAADVRRQFPALQPPDALRAVWEPRAGILFPERCISAHLAMARQHGASLRTDEPVLRWQPDGAGVRVETARQTYLADRLVLTAGAWVQSLLPDLELPLQVERQVLFWFEPAAAPERFHPKQCPIHLWQVEGGRCFYGFPDLGDGVKLAGHHEGEHTSPDQVRREVDPAEVEAMRELARRYLPDAAGRLRSSCVCLYTNTPDAHFWIDHHPEHSQVLIASPCSGHGFKFSSAVGEVISELVGGKAGAHDLSLFRTRWPVRPKPPGSPSAGAPCA